MRSRRDRREFIELPFRLHANAEQWVPPLRIERRLFLSPRFNAYFKRAEAELFLARRDGRVVGRISAQIDSAFNEYHRNAWGHFGFLELEDDPEVADALFDAAEGWLRERGRDRMVGPMDFSMNDECGVLIEGFDREPMIKQPWHPPYYQRLCEGGGLEKAIDLYMWELHVSDRSIVHPSIFELAEKLEPEHGVRIRKMSRRHLRRDLDVFGETYNAAWADNWGFVPYSKEDLDHYAQELQLVFDRNWFMVAENAEGETVGVAITVPDINQVLKRMNGRLAAARLVALPAPREDHGPRAGGLPRGQARVPAHRRGGGPVRRALRHGLDAAPDLGRGGLDPRDQRRDEPGHGGDGRPDRQALPDVRAVRSRRRLDSSGRPSPPTTTTSRPRSWPRSARSRFWPSPPETRVLDRPPPPSLPVVVAVGTVGFIAGVLAWTLVRVLRRPRSSSAVRALGGRRRRGIEVAGTRSFLVDVHLLKR